MLPRGRPRRHSRALPVALAGLYLLVLAGVVMFAPARAQRFLAGHASSAFAHYLEIALRLLLGGSLVLSSPRMRFLVPSWTLGWILIGTSAVLVAVPWRLHQRFARWAVPLATRYMALLAVGALAGGLLLLFSLLPGPGAS